MLGSAPSAAAEGHVGRSSLAVTDDAAPALRLLQLDLGGTMTGEFSDSTTLTAAVGLEALGAALEQRVPDVLTEWEGMTGEEPWLSLPEPHRADSIRPVARSSTSSSNAVKFTHRGGRVTIACE
jgi:hypothetical protein